MESDTKKTVEANSGVSTANYADRLRMKLEITRGCKYKASIRLKRKYNYSNLSLCFISAYLVIANVFSSILESNFFTQENINIISISLSIVVLVYSQIILSKGYNKDSYILKKQANEIDILHDKLIYETENLKYNPTKFHERVNELSKKYSIILKSEDQGHEKIDYYMFLMEQNLKPFKLKEKRYNFYRTNMIIFRYKHLTFLHYYILTYLSPLLLILWYYIEQVKI